MSLRGNEEYFLLLASIHSIMEGSAQSPNH